MASSKKFVSNPKSRSKKPENPYYTRHREKRANLSQDVTKKSTDTPPVNQSTFTYKTYSGCNFDLYLKGDVVMLRSHPQVGNHGKNTEYKIKLYEFAIGTKVGNSFNAYNDTSSAELISGLANYLSCTPNQILSRCESYCNSVQDYYESETKKYNRTMLDPSKQKVKNLMSKIKGVQ